MKRKRGYIMRDKFMEMIMEMINEKVVITKDNMDIWSAAGELPTKVLTERLVKAEKFYQDNLVELSNEENIGIKQEIEEYLIKFKNKIASRKI
jgi:hypothetical protein